ncbi:MAG: D-aminoacylase [Thermoanaerobaculia bacterium]|nr:D-aminoacylase [Thermoanaerobaculia bacterium]
MSRPGLTPLLGLAAALLAAPTPSQEAASRGPDPRPPTSLLIRGARVIDGSGAPAFDGDVRVADGDVVAIGELAPIPGEPVVDAAGLVLAPGFIDTHSHHDVGLDAHPQALAVISQGITTIVVGQDGTSNSPLATWFQHLEESPPAVNVASYTGHGSLRRAVMGGDYARHATAEEILRMREILRREMESGALGLSTGLNYDPGLYASSEEVIALAEQAAAYGGRYISHLRSEDRDFWRAVEEIIEIGRRTGIPVQISHTKLAMKSLWGQAHRLIERLDLARAEGVDITADLYPYVHWQSSMTLLFPRRNFGDLDEARFVLAEIVPADGIVLARFGANRDYVGRTLAAIAAERGTTPEQTLLDLLAEALHWERQTGHDGESIMAQAMDPADVAVLLAWPHANLCTDGGLGGRHPRGFGAFPKFLAEHGPRVGGLDLETAVHKVSGLAAAHVGLRDRGLVRPGFRADLVLFDPDTIAPAATFEQPQLPAVGIAGVWVNGVRVWAEGGWTGERPGAVVLGPGARPPSP